MTKTTHDIVRAMAGLRDGITGIMANRVLYQQDVMVLDIKVKRLSYLCDLYSHTNAVNENVLNASWEVIDDARERLANYRRQRWTA